MNDKMNKGFQEAMKLNQRIEKWRFDPNLNPRFKGKRKVVSIKNPSRRKGPCDICGSIGRNGKPRNVMCRGVEVAQMGKEEKRILYFCKKCFKFASSFNKITDDKKNLPNRRRGRKPINHQQKV